MNTKHLATALLFLPAWAMAEDNPHGPETFQHLQMEASAGASRREGSLQRWEMNGWVGGDTDKLAFSSEGKRLKDTVEDAEVTALASHALSEFWDMQAGVRQEFRPHPATYAAVGFEGLFPYYFETKLHLFISDMGYASLRLHEENNLFLSQNLVLKPYGQVELSFANNEQQQRGAGVSRIETGLQLRYDITHVLSPFVDVRYERAFGRTAKFLANEGETGDDVSATVGLRVIF